MLRGAIVSDKPKTGRRVQIYIPSDLVDYWDSLPRYERSATVAEALRSYVQQRQSANFAHKIAHSADDAPGGDEGIPH